MTETRDGILFARCRLLDRVCRFSGARARAAGTRIGESLQTFNRCTAARRAAIARSLA